MKILVVSGIWPPDVGGPASHAPDVADFMLDRGHQVEVIVTADAKPEPRAYPVAWISRRLPKGVIHVAGAIAIARAAHRADVVYTTGMFARTAAACALVRRPYVIKLTGDPAFERARRFGHADGDVEEYQDDSTGGASNALLRRLRDLSIRPAAQVVCPSTFIRELALSWGVLPERASVLPNPTPPIPPLRSRDEVRASLGVSGAVLVFAGRFGPQKALDVALDAVAQAKGVTFVLAGDGDGAEELETRASALGDRVRLLGPLPRAEVLELFAAADASLISSAWENFPHTAVESLAVGTPVIATAVGGVPEVVQDGVNGLLVEPNDADALAHAIERFFADDALRTRLHAQAAESVTRYAPERVFGELERMLETAAAT